MKKTLPTALLAAEATAFASLMLLFFVNTDKPYLLLIPVAGVIVGCLIFRRMTAGQPGNNTPSGSARSNIRVPALTLLLATGIALAVFGLLALLP